MGPAAWQILPEIGRAAHPSSEIVVRTCSSDYFRRFGFRVKPKRDNVSRR